MGMHVSVYRDTSSRCDCTAGGVSVRFVELCVVNVDGPWKPDENRPAVMLESHVPGCLRIVEIGENGKALRMPDRNGPMFGGNYAATSDSRFSNKCAELLGHRFYGAVPIHDRYEVPQRRDE